MNMEVIWVLAIADFVQRIISSLLEGLMSILQRPRGLLHWSIAGNCVCNKVHKGFKAYIFSYNLECCPYQFCRN